jgi:hypothetical protein
VGCLYQVLWGYFAKDLFIMLLILEHQLFASTLSPFIPSCSHTFSNRGLPVLHICQDIDG